MNLWFRLIWLLLTTGFRPKLAMPGEASVCFSCGQPLPRDIGTSVMAAPPAMSAFLREEQIAYVADTLRVALS